MISSPTEKGVMMIGGSWSSKIGENFSAAILELSGHSKETLEWKILEQKLQHPRFNHVSFSISNDIAATLTTNSIGSFIQNVHHKVSCIYSWLRNLLLECMHYLQITNQM